MNSISIIGRIGNEPELAYTKGGHARMNLRVAVDRRYKENGEWQKGTVWYGVTLWGKRAEGVGQYLTKGRQVGVTGSPFLREYETRSGEKRSALEIENADVTLVGGRDGGGEKRGGFGGGSKPSGGGFNEYPADDFGDDEIPF